MGNSHHADADHAEPMATEAITQLLAMPVSRLSQDSTTLQQATSAAAKVVGPRQQPAPFSRSPSMKGSLAIYRKQQKAQAKAANGSQ
jgi:hypothetical protein